MYDENSMAYALNVFLDNNWEKCFPSFFRYSCKEMSVYGSYKNERRKPIGRIDWVARNYSKKYLIESKMGQGQDAFWNAFKVLGYKEAYCIDNSIFDTTHRDYIIPTIMINADIWNPQYRNVALALGIHYILVIPKLDALENKYMFTFRSSIWTNKV